MNPVGQDPFKISVESVLKSVMIADPLRILDCSPITDGAAALLLCPVEMAKKLSKKPAVKIIGIGHATDSIALHSRKDDTSLPATAKAAKMAFKHGWKVMVSHRSGETEDPFIADLAVALGCGQIKAGAP